MLFLVKCDCVCIFHDRPDHGLVACFNVRLATIHVPPKECEHFPVFLEVVEVTHVVLYHLVHDCVVCKQPCSFTFKKLVGRSLIQMQNKNGLSTVPCGTSNTTFVGDEVWPSSITYWVLCSKKDAIHSCVLPWTLHFLTFCCIHMPNAFMKLSRMTSTCSLSFGAFTRSLC